MLKIYLKKFCKIIAAYFLYYTGIIFLYKKIRFYIKGGSITILAYHNISDDYPDYLDLSVPVSLFKKQMLYIKNNYDIISLDRAIDIINNKERINRNVVVVTFDDNYIEYYKVIYPFFSENNITGTFFVAVQPLEDNEPLFVDKLIYSIAETNKDQIDLTRYGLGILSLKSKDEKEKSIKKINEKSKQMNFEKRNYLIQDVCRRLDYDTNKIRDRYLNWSHVAEMASGGMEIGSHTMTHPNLRMVSVKEAKYEIWKSKEIIEKRLGKDISSIAYPFGGIDCYNQQILDLCKKNNYKGAVTLHQNSHNSNVYELPRMNMDASMYSCFKEKFSKPIFNMEFSGIRRKMMLRFSQTKKAQIKSEVVTGKKKKLKCLYIIDTLRGLGGTENHLLRLVAGLDKDRFENMIITFEAKKEMLLKYRKAGATILELPLDKIYSFKAIRLFYRLVRTIRAYNPDIIQTYHFMSDTYGVLAARLAKKVPIISSRRDMGDLKTKRQIYLNKAINPLISRFVAVCDEVKLSLSKNEKIDSGKVETLYNGIDVEKYKFSNEQNIIFRKELGIENNFIVGIACLFRPEKDVQLFIMAFARVAKKVKSAKAIIVGAGPDEKIIKDTAKELGVFDKCIFTGYIENVQEYLNVMDVVCLTPKENEGLSNVIIEEIALGKPVIATDVGGNKELIEDGETGFIIDVGAKDDLVDKIMILYNDKEKRVEMGKKARLKCEKTFSIEKMVKKQKEIFHECLCHKK